MTILDPGADEAVHKGTGQAYLLVGTALLVVILVGAPLQLWNSYAGLAITEYVLILGCAVAFVRLKGVPLRSGLRLQPVSAAVLLFSVLIGMGGYAVVVLALKLLQPLIGDPSQLGTLEAPKTPAQLVMLLAAGALGAGLCEEALFRGAVQGVLTRNGRWRGIIVTALLFGAFHLNPWQLVAGIILGVAFGAMVERTGSLLPAITGHACANATAFTLAYLYRQNPDVEPWGLNLGLAAVFPVAIALLWRATRNCRPEPGPLSVVPARITRSLRLAIPAGAMALVILLITVRVSHAVGAYRITTDALAPEIQRGEVVFTIHPRWFSSPIRAGDFVSFHDGSLVKVRKVIAVEEDSIHILDAGKERLIRSDAVHGKVVHRLQVEALRQAVRTRQEN